MVVEQSHPTTMPPPTTGPVDLAVRQNTAFNLQLSGIEDLQRLARLFSASGLFGNSGNSERHIAECATKILAGAEAGFAPFASIAGVTVINGKPGFGANLLAQAIKRHPLYDYRVLEKTEKICRIKFLAGQEELGVEIFTLQMAQRAGLIKDGGMYSKYPEAMLFSRCLSAGMRTHCPDALGGVAAYTPEELGAQGQIDDNGAVTVSVIPEKTAPEPPDPKPPDPALVAQAQAAADRAGFTPEGLESWVEEISSAEAFSLAQLPAKWLQKLVASGISADVVASHNRTAAEALAETPTHWQQPVAQPEPQPA